MFDRALAGGALFCSQRFGTPLQDALRRDLTINALFYNINEEKVEDFTGDIQTRLFQSVFVDASERACL